MKNYKVFSLLTTTVLLIACPGKPHLKVYEPEFAEMGVEITVDQFTTEYNAGLAGLTLATNFETNPWGNMRVSKVSSYENNCKYKYGNVKGYDKSVGINKKIAEFDSETKVILYQIDEKVFDNTKDKNGTKIENEKYENGERYSEKVRIAGKEYFAYVLPSQRLVKATDESEITETYTEEMAFAGEELWLATAIVNYFELKNFPKRLEALSEEALANYSFYKNGNTYTWLFNVTEENAPGAVIEKIIRTVKQQIIFNGDSYEYISSSTYDCDRKFLEYVADNNKDVRKKGDYDRLVKKTYLKIKYDGSPEDVHLEPVDYEGFEAEVNIVY